MCTELVSQCDWCLFRRHVAWDECRIFQRLLYLHIKHQVFPMPTPENCGETIRRGTGFMSAHVVIKMSLGACPAPVCVSELLATIERKKTAIRAERRRRERQLYLEAAWAANMAWGRKYCSRVAIKLPSTVSLLTQALREQEEGEWEDTTGSDSDTDNDNEYDGDNVDLEAGEIPEHVTPNSLEGIGQSIQKTDEQTYQ